MSDVVVTIGPRWKVFARVDGKWRYAAGFPTDRAETHADAAARVRGMSGQYATLRLRVYDGFVPTPMEFDP